MVNGGGGREKMKIFSIVLSIIAIVGSIYSYRKTCAAIRKIEDVDNAIFQWMKGDLNSRRSDDGE